MEKILTTYKCVTTGLSVVTEGLKLVNTINNDNSDNIKTDWLHSYANGNKSCDDDLLLEENYRREWAFLQTITIDMPFVSDQEITCINVEDLWKDGTGGYTKISAGGVGHQSVVISLRSQRGRGFHFRIKIWGKKVVTNKCTTNKPEVISEKQVKVEGNVRENPEGAKMADSKVVSVDSGSEKTEFPKKIQNNLRNLKTIPKKPKIPIQRNLFVP